MNTENTQNLDAAADVSKAPHRRISYPFFTLRPPINREDSHVTFSTLTGGRRYNAQLTDVALLPAMPQVSSALDGVFFAGLVLPRILIARSVISEHTWVQHNEDGGEDVRPQKMSYVLFDELVRDPHTNDLVTKQVPMKYEDKQRSESHQGHDCSWLSRSKTRHSTSKYIRKRESYVNRVQKKRSRRLVTVYETTEIKVLLPPQVMGYLARACSQSGNAIACAVALNSRKMEQSRHIPGRALYDALSLTRLRNPLSVQK